MHMLNIFGEFVYILRHIMRNYTELMNIKNYHMYIGNEIHILHFASLIFSKQGFSVVKIHRCNSSEELNCYALFTLYYN